MTAADKFTWINDSISNGKTVLIHAIYRTTKVTPKAAASFAAAGRPIFKLVNDSLYMSAGKSYVCVDFNGITIQ